jgi:membrane-associated protein
VSTVARIADALARAIASTGEVAPVVLFFASFVEHVFPPFPGDLLVVLGAWYAVHGLLSWPATLVSVTAGAVAGAWLDYRIGAAVGCRLERRAARKGGLTEARLARFEASYRRFGAWLLLANRFLPGVRAFLFMAAGASGIPLRRVLLLGGVSAVLWNSALLAAGGLLAENLEELVALFERYTRAATIGLLACAAAAGLWLLLRRGGRETPA